MRSLRGIGFGVNIRSHFALNRRGETSIKWKRIEVAIIFKQSLVYQALVQTAQAANTTAKFECDLLCRNMSVAD